MHPEDCTCYPCTRKRNERAYKKQQRERVRAARK